MDTHTETKTQSKTKFAHQVIKLDEAVKLDDRLLLGYASSSMRLLIFMEHCGPSHPCTMNESKLFRRYSAAVAMRHDALNVRQNRSVVAVCIANRLVHIAADVVHTFDLEPEFEAEILTKFASQVRARFY